MKVDPQLVRRLQRRVGHLMQDQQRQRHAAGQSGLRGEDEMQAGRSFISRAIVEHRSALVEKGDQPLAWKDEDALGTAIEARIFGAGRLQHLIDDDTIENIAINGCDVVWIDYADGRREQVEPVAETDEELIELIQILAAHAGLSSRPFDLANTILNLRLPGGSRLSAVQGNTTRPVAAIRRHRYPKVTLGDLIGTDTMTGEVADFLRHAVKAKLNIMICGGMNSGKTTLLRALTSELEREERVITIESSLEIGLDGHPEAHANVVVMEESEANAEGHGGVSMEELLRQTQRLSPDRVIVGEVRGSEVITMLNAMSQGIDGSLSTIHTSNARGAFNRIAILAKMSVERLDVDTSSLLTADALDLVVFVKKDEDGGSRRSVREVLEVNGFDGTHVMASCLFADDGSGTAVRNADVSVSEESRAKLQRSGWSPAPQGW